MNVKEKLIGIMGTAHPRLLSRLGTFGIGLLAIIAVVATGVVGGGTGTLQQAYAQENSNRCPEGYTFNRGLCTANVIPGKAGGCPEGTIPNDDGTCDVVLEGQLNREFCEPPLQFVSESRWCADPSGRLVHPAHTACEYSDGTFQIVDPSLQECPAKATGEVVKPSKSSEPTCPDTGNFREPKIVNGQCQVRPGEGEPEPGDDEEEEDE